MEIPVWSTKPNDGTQETERPAIQPKVRDTDWSECERYPSHGRYSPTVAPTDECQDGRFV